MTPNVSHLLRDDHEVRDFDSGQPTLDAWLHREAARAQRQRTARSYVWTARGDLRVVAYYSIAPTAVRRDGLSRALAGGVTAVPAYLLARLALDRRLHGQGLGGQLLVDALEVIVRASRSAAGRLIVVDAIDGAAQAFYEHYGFRPIDSASARRLVMKVATAEAAVHGPPRT